MAKSKDAWRQLMSQLSQTRALSAEWLNHQPAVEEFGLEEYNLNALYKNHKKYIESRNERVAALEKQKPRPVRGTFSWEGYVALLFMFGMVTYQAFAKTPSWAVFGFLALGSLFWFFFYYFRRRKKQIEYKAKCEEISQRQTIINAEEYQYEEGYNQLIKYGRAVYDYEAWERRSRPSFWKDAKYDEFVNELISMFKTYGIDAFDEYRRCISIIYEEEGERTALYLTLKDRITRKDVVEYLKALQRNELSKGIIISTRGFEGDGLDACKKYGVQAWRIEDIINWEKEIEKDVLEELKKAE